MSPRDSDIYIYVYVFEVEGLWLYLEAHAARRLLMTGADNPINDYL